MAITRWSRRNVFTALGAVVAAGPVLPARAQLAGDVSRIVFPFGAGGGGDALSRLLGEAFGAELKRSFIIENRTGADGRIGIQTVKAAPADGKTLLVTTGPTMWLYPMTKDNVGYDPIEDFTAIGRVASFEFCIAVPKDSAVRSVKDLAIWTKANPDKATYALPGAGTIPHFIGVSIAKAFGVDMRHLAYRGGAPAIQDLVGNQIPISIGTLADALAQHQAGTIRIIATSGKARAAFTPDVPTILESGFEISGDAWYGLWAPKATPAAAVEPIAAALTRTLARADIQERLTKLGLVAAPADGPQLVAAMRANVALWKPVIDAGGAAMRQ